MPLNQNFLVIQISLTPLDDESILLCESVNAKSKENDVLFGQNLTHENQYKSFISSMKLPCTVYLSLSGTLSDVENYKIICHEDTHFSFVERAGMSSERKSPPK
jgi:hypothetical protein